MQHAKRLFKRPQARHDSNYYDSAPTRGRLASGESSPSSLGWALTSRSRPPFPPEAAPGVPWAAPGVPSGRSVLTAAAAGACPLVVGAGAPPVPRRPARDDSPLATTLPLVSPAVLPACPLPSYMAMICSAMSSTSACVTLNASNHGPPPECAGRACCVPPSLLKCLDARKTAAAATHRGGYCSAMVVRRLSLMKFHATCAKSREPLMLLT